jgi:hypothetical protein
LFSDHLLSVFLCGHPYCKTLTGYVLNCVIHNMGTIL